jgi:hypothetical protein
MSATPASSATSSHWAAWSTPTLSGPSSTALTPKNIADMDIVIAIDPGLVNAAILWIGFDRNNVAWVFDEVLLQRKTTIDYVLAILKGNAKWGIGNGEDRQDHRLAAAQHDVDGEKADGDRRARGPREGQPDHWGP